MRDMLKKFRDSIVVTHEIERLRSIETSPQEAQHAFVTASPMQSHAQGGKPLIQTFTSLLISIGMLINRG